MKMNNKSVLMIALGACFSLQGLGLGLPLATGALARNQEKKTERAAQSEEQSQNALNMVPKLPAGVSGLADCTVLIIRHAEKPEEGKSLSAEGELRAEKYSSYFAPFDDGKRKIRVDSLWATAKSKHSNRPKQTLKPLSEAIGQPIDDRFADDDYQSLCTAIKSEPHNKNLLVAWHHGKLPDLVNGLGGHAEKLLPDGKWPEDVYNWVIELQFDKDGKLVDEKKIVESF